MASGVLSDTNLWRVKPDILFPDHGEAQEPTALFLKLTNRKKWFPVVSVTAHIMGTLHGRPVKLEVFFPFIAAGSSLKREVVLSPKDRGFLEIQKIYLFTRFPFGLLWKRWTIWDGRGGMFIYPRLLPSLEENFALFSQRMEQDVPADILGDGSAAGGIREFKPGDNPKKIHWKASAKRNRGVEDEQEWFLKEMERDGIKEVFLSWPEWETLANMNPSEFENFIRFTATFVWDLKKAGHKIWLLVFAGSGGPVYCVGGSREGAGVSSIMEFLSIFEPGHAKDVFSHYLEPVHDTYSIELREKAIPMGQRFNRWKGEVTVGARN